jgi:hypothetical protein
MVCGDNRKGAGTRKVYIYRVKIVKWEKWTLMDILDEVDEFGAGCLLQLFYTRLAASLPRILAKRGLMKTIESWEAQ